MRIPTPSVMLLVAGGLLGCGSPAQNSSRLATPAAREAFIQHCEQTMATLLVLPSAARFIRGSTFPMLNLFGQAVYDGAVDSPNINGVLTRTRFRCYGNDSGSVLIEQLIF